MGKEFNFPGPLEIGRVTWNLGFKEFPIWGFKIPWGLAVNFQFNFKVKPGFGTKKGYPNPVYQKGLFP